MCHKAQTHCTHQEYWSKCHLLPPSVGFYGCMTPQLLTGKEKLFSCISSHTQHFRWNQWRPLAVQKDIQLHAHGPYVYKPCSMWFEDSVLHVSCAVSSQTEEEVPIGGYRLSRFCSTAHPESVLKQIFTTCCQDHHIWGPRKQHHQFPAPWSAVQRSETRIYNR